MFSYKFVHADYEYGFGFSITPIAFEKNAMTKNSMSA